MKYRKLGNTDFNVSEISFGAWAIGGTWGIVKDVASIKALHQAVEKGINFFDTADVYGDGHSESLLRHLQKDIKKDIIIATKTGARVPNRDPKGYNKKNITEYVERSLKKLDVETIDLLQLHCPPTEIYYMPETFDIFDELVKDGKVKHYGVSVEKVEEALKAIEYPNVETVQIIFNMFRQRPSGLFFEQAKKKNIGIIARVPLSSGMLTGKMNANTFFANDDHRLFNRKGEAFDKGETFSGIEYEIGLEAVEMLKDICPDDYTLSQFALKWILMFEEVSCTIPGAKNASQVDDNTAASEKHDLTRELMQKVNDIYESKIKKLVHHHW